MSKQFKAGDKVRCIRTDSKNLLTLNKVYTILSIQSFTSELFVVLNRDDGTWWNINRFTPSFEHEPVTLPDELFEL